MNEKKCREIKPYYQKEFEKISSSNGTYKGKLNWCAFFFSWAWALTKGLWGLALMNIAISIILSSIDEKLTPLTLLISILFGMRGTYFYYNLVKKKNSFQVHFSTIK